VILGVGIATDVPNIRDEFAAAGVPWEKRVGRMLEGLRLCRALWTGEPVDWDGRWPVKAGVIGPTPYRRGGPPIWIGGSVQASLERAGKAFDGWFPTGPDAARWGAQWAEVKRIAAAAGRAPDAVTGAIYLTLAVDENAAAAEERVNTYLERYYGVSAQMLRRRQACYAGPAAGAAEWLKSYVDAGASHLVLRFAGDHERQMDTMARVRSDLGW